MDTGRSGVLCPACVLRSALESGRGEGEGADDSRAGLPRPFGAYLLLEQIGRGGMGVVYRARQIGLDRMVAVKLLLGGGYSSEAAVTRFRLEAAAAARLQHPNIVAIHELGEIDDRPYYAMDLVHGRNLAEHSGGRPLPARQAAELLRVLARAVQHAHEHGVLHRDLKPSNVLIDDEGRPRITDFGLAKLLGTPEGATVTGQVLGSPSYVAPEQAGGGTGPIGVGSDVYGLGALCYHLLTGRAPFNAASPTETLSLVISADPVRPRLLNPTLPRDLETICLKCLAKEPARRYASAAELAEDVERYLNDRPIRARPLCLGYRSLQFFRRHRLACGAAIVVAVLVAAGATSLIYALRARAIAQQRRTQIEQIFTRALHVADPGYSHGRNATLKDLLDDTARWAPAEFVNDPRLEAAIQARMGETYCKLSLFADAAPHLESAWSTRQRLLDEDHPDYLASLRDLGVLRLWQQRYAEAEEHLGRVLAIQERTLGRDAEETLRTRSEMCFGRQLRLTLRIGLAENEREKFLAEQERFAREGWDLAKRRWGKEHPLTLNQEWNVAGTLLGGTASQMAEGERLIADNYRTSLRVLGRNHPNTLSAMADWGRALLLLKRDGEALQLLQEEVPVAERSLGPEHMVTAWAMQQWERALRNAGRNDEANALIPRYVTAWMRTYGPANRFVRSFAFWNLHRLATDCRRPEEAALVAIRQLSELSERGHVPSGSPLAGMMQLVLADARLVQDRTAEAVQHLQQASESLGAEKPTAWQLWLVYLELGQHQLEKQQFTAAEATLLAAFEGLNQRGTWEGPTPAIQTSVLTALVRLYSESNRSDSAAAWQRKLEELRMNHGT